jgi:hypothetical protein
MTDTSISGNPPRWAEWLLRVFLDPRDRKTITGDLLEEYREAVLPSRGQYRARLWYVRQVLSLIDGVKIGTVLGAVFGAWMLTFTWLAPLAEDTALALAGFYGPMVLTWGLAAFAATRRTRRLIHGVKVGATVGLATFLIFNIAAIVRVNLFLEVISRRSDWQGPRPELPGQRIREPANVCELRLPLGASSHAPDRVDDGSRHRADWRPLRHVRPAAEAPAINEAFAASASASRWNRATRSESRAKSSGRTLIATSRLSFVSRARHTRPIPPSPSSERTS